MQAEFEASIFALIFHKLAPACTVCKFWVFCYVLVAHHGFYKTLSNVRLLLCNGTMQRTVTVEPILHVRNKLSTYQMPIRELGRAGKCFCTDKADVSVPALQLNPTISPAQKAL